MHLSVGNNSLKQTFKGASPSSRLSFQPDRPKQGKTAPRKASVQLQQKEPDRRTGTSACRRNSDDQSSQTSAPPCRHQGPGSAAAPHSPIRAPSSQGA